MTKKVTSINSSEIETGKISTYYSRAWFRFRKTRLAIPALIAFSIIVIFTIGANIFAPYDPLKIDYRAILTGPTQTHFLGTDEIGRDTLSRILHGGRVSLLVGVLAVSLAVTIGLTIGLIAGYFGGWIDEILMRIMDAIWSFPGLILAMAITTALRPSLENAALAIGIVSIPGIARLSRAQTLTIREMEFVLAAKALGASKTRMIVKHILPSIIGPIIVQASLMFGGAILSEAGLSFLGLGVPPPTPTWGQMIRQASGVLVQSPWYAFSPGVAIFIVVLSINLIGDGIRAAFDPRSRVSSQ